MLGWNHNMQHLTNGVKMSQRIGDNLLNKQIKLEHLFLKVGIVSLQIGLKHYSLSSNNHPQMLAAGELGIYRIVDHFWTERPQNSYKSNKQKGTLWQKTYFPNMPKNSPATFFEPLAKTLRIFAMGIFRHIQKIGFLYRYCWLLLSSV